MAANNTEFSRGDVISRKYEIESPLGDGLYGASYRARHITSGRNLVIKFLRPELFPGDSEMNAFQAAFQEAKELRHPGLVRFGEINKHHSIPYYTQEYFKSQSLRQLMDEYRAQGRKFTLHEVCQLAVKTLEAIQAAHDAGLVHGNLKPENILVHNTRTGPGQNKVVRHVKLTGTGLSATLQNIKSLVEFDSRPEYVYQAPETATFTKEGGPSVDIYSIGVIFYEMLCGQTPGTPFQYPSTHREDLPDHVDQIIEVSLSSNTEDRYPSALDMVRDIQRCLQTEMLAASKPTSLKNLLLAIGGSVVLAALLMVYLSTREGVEMDVQLGLENKAKRDEIIMLNGPPEQSPVKAPKNMQFIPSGWYLSGQMPSEDETLFDSTEAKAEKVNLPGFFIDRYEYGNEKGMKAITGITQTQAKEFCESQEKRLCTAPEWEKACKGTNNTIYSYSDSFDPEVCGPDMNAEYKSGDRPGCRSDYVVFDMSGGFQEWTATPIYGKKSRHVLKGGTRGTWSPEASVEQRLRVERGYRCAYSVDRSANFSSGTLSFRCCLSVSAAEVPEATTE